MNAIQLLSYLHELGVKVTAKGEALALDGPQGVLTQNLVSTIKEHKAELLKLAIHREPVQFKELMKQAANVLKCPIDDLPLHHFEQWEIDSINAGTFWCGQSKRNMILEWAAFNLNVWLGKEQPTAKH